MRHFYYRHDLQARLGAHLSAGLVLGHKDLAAVPGVWLETITAMLNRWGNEGLISQQPGRITPRDVRRLQQMAED